MKESTAFKLVKDELDRATKEYGPFNSCHEGYAILLEEVEELWEEIKAGNGESHRAASEATQIAAMAIRYLIDACDETHAKEHEKKVERFHHDMMGMDNYRGGGYSG